MLIVAGALMLADAVLTLVWQEPVSAVYATILQARLGDDLHRLATRRPSELDRAALAQLASERRRMAFLARRRAAVRAWTIADEMGDPLKHDADPLDTCRGMRTQELKLRIQRADYAVDPALVAEAMLRHAVSYKRCWKPCTDWATPREFSATLGGPSATLPIQVSGTADAAV